MSQPTPTSQQAPPPPTSGTPIPGRTRPGSFRIHWISVAVWVSGCLLAPLSIAFVQNSDNPALLSLCLIAVPLIALLAAANYAAWFPLFRKEIRSRRGFLLAWIPSILVAVVADLLCLGPLLYVVSGNSIFP